MPLEHGSRVLRSVIVESYNVEIREGEGFLGDRANKRIFKAMLDHWRDRLRRNGGDPLDGRPTEDIYRDKQELERILLSGDPDTAGVLIGSIEDFAGELAAVIKRLLETEEWRATQCIAIGGGFREGRVSELVTGRTAVMLRAEGVGTSLVPLRHHPEVAGLIGGVHLAPDDVLREFQGILAVDIGGTNVRTGIVEPELKDGEIAGASVWSYELWRHADKKPSKEELLKHMIEQPSLCGSVAASRSSSRRVGGARVFAKAVFSCGNMQSRCDRSIASHGIIPRFVRSRGGDLGVFCQPPSSSRKNWQGDHQL